MKNIFKIGLLLFVMVLLVGCGKKEKIEYSTNVNLGEKTYIEQLTKVGINGTNDYFMITEKVKWEVPKEADGNTTVSFVITVPYVINVNGKEYKGTYELGDVSKQEYLDKNPKYKFEITNLKSDYSTEVLITKK